MMNPNYTRRKITKLANLELVIDPWGWILNGGDEARSEASISLPKSSNINLEKMTKNDFLIACLTILGFSFNDKLWGKISFSFTIYKYSSKLTSQT